MMNDSTRFNTGVAGIYVSAGLDDEGQPYVSINTEDMVPQHRYDENTGLLGTERPYTYEQDGASAVVKGPDGQIVARHFPQPDSSSSRLAARAHAEHLNDGWAKQCGMPAISIHLNDAELYDARDHNPKLRKEETSV